MEASREHFKKMSLCRVTIETMPQNVLTFHLNNLDRFFHFYKSKDGLLPGEFLGRTELAVTDSLLYRKLSDANITFMSSLYHKNFYGCN